jgi:hypothetical protein
MSRYDTIQESPPGHTPNETNLDCAIIREIGAKDFSGSQAKTTLEPSFDELRIGSTPQQKAWNSGVEGGRRGAPQSEGAALTVTALSAAFNGHVGCPRSHPSGGRRFD